MFRSCWGICTRLYYKFPTESNSERILKIYQYLVKLWSRVRCLVFFDSRCRKPLCKWISLVPVVLTCGVWLLNYLCSIACVECFKLIFICMNVQLNVSCVWIWVSLFRDNLYLAFSVLNSVCDNHCLVISLFLFPAEQVFQALLSPVMAPGMQMALCLLHWNLEAKQTWLSIKENC